MKVTTMPTKRSLIAIALLTACGGHKAEKTTSATPPPSDSDFRHAFENPGGMWMPSQIALSAHQETLKKLGVSIDPKALSNPLSPPLAAIVALGGCTGSFVSAEGLVVTNHHCVQEALQVNATPESNLVENGFLAKTRAEEKPAGPAQHIRVLQAYRDVTHEMRDGLEQIADPHARTLEIESRSKKLVAACEKDRPGTKCEVDSFFSGGQYQLDEYLEIRDVRVVYAPPRSVGNYGGEVDNWEWPRHTGDWSYFRAYVGKDGKPAEFAADNVPYKPKYHLQVTTAGLAPGDLVMVTGYPGYTNRTASASQVHHDVEWTYPYTIAVYKALYALVETHAKDKGPTGIKAGVLKQMVQNGLENQEGAFANITKGDLLAKKDALDAKVKAWAAQPGHEKQKGDIDKAEAIIKDLRRTEKVDAARDQVFYSGSSLLRAGIGLYYWTTEHQKPDAQRREGYQERDLPNRIARAKQFAVEYDRTLDREQLRLFLVRALDLPDADRAWLAALLGVKKGQKIDSALIDKTLTAWYAAPKLESDKLRIEILQKGTPKTLETMKDPFVQAALRIWPIYKAEETRIETRAGELALVEPAYAAAMRDVMGGMLAPDANLTLRISYGTVRSLAPGKASPFTTASQIVAKDTGKEPFDSPASLLTAIKGKEFGAYADASLGGDLPIDFLSDLDITGGNSGSPVLNGKGELVGLAFDGNKEGIASDVVFNGKTTRTIQVDARYMIWTMEHLAGARHLVTEMGLPLRMKP